MANLSKVPDGDLTALKRILSNSGFDSESVKLILRNPCLAERWVPLLSEIANGANPSGPLNLTAMREGTGIVESQTLQILMIKAIKVNLKAVRGEIRRLKGQGISELVADLNRWDGKEIRLRFFAPVPYGSHWSTEQVLEAVFNTEYVPANPLFVYLLRQYAQELEKWGITNMVGLSESTGLFSFFAEDCEAEIRPYADYESDFEGKPWTHHDNFLVMRVD